MQTNIQLPEYTSIQRVRGAKIADIIYPPKDSGSRLVTLILAPPAPSVKTRQTVPVEFMFAHSPMIGGYFVRHEDGKAGYLPSDQFESAFSLAPAGVIAGIAQIGQQQVAGIDWRAAATGSINGPDYGGNHG